MKEILDSDFVEKKIDINIKLYESILKIIPIGYFLIVFMINERNEFINSGFYSGLMCGSLYNSYIYQLIVVMIIIGMVISIYLMIKIPKEHLNKFLIWNPFLLLLTFLLIDLLG